MTRVLFVCLGNICRSPLGEAILRRQAAEAGIELIVDSCGLGDWHVGERSDARAINVGVGRGYTMNHRARQIRPSDFREFDLIVAMDHENLAGLARVSGHNSAIVRLARSFDPNADSEIVADPYYGDMDGFEECADQLEAACRGIIAALETSGNEA